MNCPHRPVRWPLLCAGTYLLIVWGCGRDPLGNPALGPGSVKGPRTGDPAGGTMGADAARARDPADASPTTDGCIPLRCSDPSCYPPYCGAIGDGCGGVLDCGPCPLGWSCNNRLCQAPPEVCTPTACSSKGLFYCGTIGDSCGRQLDCACPDAAQDCKERLCVERPLNCTPLTCEVMSKPTYCGVLGDGCGGVLVCGDRCSELGLTCVDHFCGAGGPSANPPPHPPPPPPPAPPPPCPPPPPPFPFLQE
jgi:hypothetical protein